MDFRPLMPNSLGCSLLLVALLMALAGCERYPQGAEGRRVEVRGDSAGCAFDFVTYSLGAVAGGYSTVEVAGSEVLRFSSRTPVYGRCREDGTALLISLDPPSRDMREAAPFEIEVRVDSTGSSFFDDERLLHLG